MYVIVCHRDGVNDSFVYDQDGMEPYVTSVLEFAKALKDQYDQCFPPNFEKPTYKIYQLMEVK